MLQWEYCEVAYTPKQVIIHIYSIREHGTYEGIQTPEEWGALLTLLGADGWELVGVMRTKAPNHSLYYFKRPIDASIKADWQERTAKLVESSKQFTQKLEAEKLQKASDNADQDAID